MIRACPDWRRYSGRLALVLAGVFPMAAPASDAVCASVQIEIRQDVTLEREAFDAMMRINNGFAELDMTGVGITVNFTDADGDPVIATSDGNNTNALFYIRESSRSNIDNTSNGTVGPGQTAEIHWLIIPSPGAGGSNAVGQVYFVGADLTYTLRDQVTAMAVVPDRITVKPMPRLTLDYFLPGPVYGDDPFTAPIEPPVPFSLGLRVKNDGYGPAWRLKVESAQPEIVRNDLGLLVGFEITGSEVGGAAGTRSLLVDFGTVEAGRSAVARWTMTASLVGEFTEFSAGFTHADELGGELTSLIREVRTHTLLHDVRMDLPGRDAVRDFLARDADALAVYESESQDLPVTNLSPVAVFTQTGSAGDEVTYSLTLPAAAGPLYAGLDFPGGDTYEVRSVVRGDGKVLPVDNAWVSKSRESGTDPWDYLFNLFDSGLGGAYTVTFGLIPIPDNRAPVLAYIGRKVVLEGGSLGFLVEAGDPDGTIPSMSAAPLPDGAVFTNRGSGQYDFTWTTEAGDYGVHPVRFLASDGEFEDWEIVRIYVGHAGESLTNGLPVSLADWEPEIKNILASSLTNTATVLWESQEGVLYDIYRVDDPYSGLASWERVGSRMEGSGSTNDLTDSDASTNEMRRYYRAVLAGETPDARNAWGVIRRDAPSGFTLMAPPVRTDRRFDGELGSALAATLQGNDGGVGSGADEVYILQANGTWRTLYLDSAGIWREASGEASTYELPMGAGLWVARRAGTPARVTFTGPVGNDGTRTNRIGSGWNLLGLSEGKDLPLKQTLAQVGPVSGGAEETSDLLVLQNSNGTWRRLMYVEGWGAPYDGNWFDLQSFQIVSTNEVLQPGAAYYYLRRGDPADVRF